MAMNKENNGPIFIFLAAFLWSLSGIFTKTFAWDGVSLATLRGVIAFFLALLMTRGRKIRPDRVKVLCGICYFAQGTLFMCANKFTTAGNATVLQNTSPLYIILLNALINRKPPRKDEILVCAVLFLGVGLAFAGNFGGGAAFGNILALLSALFYAGVFFLSKQDGADPLESLVIGNSFYLFLIPFMLSNPVVRNSSLSEWLFLTAVAAFSGFGAWYCFSIGIRTTTSLQASFIALAEPVMAPLWTFLFLGEKISPLSLIGFAIVIGTLLVYNLILARRALQ